MMDIYVQLVFFIAGILISLLGNALFISWKVGTYTKTIEVYGEDIEELKSLKDEVVKLKVQIAAATSIANGISYRHEPKGD